MEYDSFLQQDTISSMDVCVICRTRGFETRGEIFRECMIITAVSSVSPPMNWTVMEMSKNVM